MIKKSTPQEEITFVNNCKYNNSNNNNCKYICAQHWSTKIKANTDRAKRKCK